MPPLPLAVFDSDGGYSYPENSAGRPSPQQDIAVIANLQSYRLGQQNALALIACLARKRGFVDDSTAVFRRHPYLRDATSLLEIL